MVNPSGRVVVIGAGMVGSSVAYAVLNQQIAREIMLIDIMEDVAKAHVLDLQDASNFTAGTKVKFGNYSDLIDGDIVVITGGAAQKEGQTRLDLLNINAGIIRSMLGEIKKTGKQVYILMVTNPVDVLTYIAATESGLPEGMVFGSGTYLDTGRLRVGLSKKINVNPRNIHAYIVGEHGDSSLPVLSSTVVAGIELGQLMPVSEQVYSELMTQVRETAYEIIKGKKATYFGIGDAVTNICRFIIRDEHKIVPVSVVLKGQYGYSDVAVSVPAKVSAKGVELIGEIKFSDHEKALFDKSVAVLQENINAIKQ